MLIIELLRAQEEEISGKKDTAAALRASSAKRAGSAQRVRVASAQLRDKEAMQSEARRVAIESARAIALKRLLK